MMKKLFAILLAIITLLSLAACGNALPGSLSTNKEAQQETFLEIKESPDKYTWYIKNYVVTAQNIAPNTELKLVFEKNSKGEEFDTFVETQNIEEIELYVKCVANNPGTTE